MLDVTRMKKNIPENENPGDCGVYALKYIECLALGSTFVGICDRNIQAIRVKLGAELFNEVESDGPQMSDPLPRRKEMTITIPHLTDSQ